MYYMYFYNVYNYISFVTAYLNILFKQVVQSWVHTLDRMTEDPMPLNIYKVIAYDNNSDSMIDLTDLFLSSSDYFSHIPNGSDNDYRMEYRFKFKNQKYRHVCSFNPNNGGHNNFLDFTCLFKKILFKKKIVMANLISSNWCECTESWICNDTEDVLKKLKKYLGPNHDFFNSDIIPKWLFPSEDFIDGQELHLMDSYGITTIIGMDSLNHIKL